MTAARCSLLRTEDQGPWDGPGTSDENEGLISLQYTAAMPIDVAAPVIANRPLSSDYNVLALAAPAIAAAASPGQFVMLRPGVGADPLLRRPFSVFEILRGEDGAATGLTILSKRIGASTSLLYDARDGQRIDCLGPLGRPFTLVDPPADAWMIAGGVGLAPFATLAQALAARGVASTLFYGARRAAELFYLDFFRDLGVELVLTTEDGSLGERGRIVAPLDRRLAARAPSAAVMLYACGPEGMLAATARTAMKYGRPCEVSVERIMGCGLGGCYSCVVPMRGGDGASHHVRSCLAGPVLRAEQIQWD
jgi:dihydroorotate dehydrogenase electron transfer subunit